MKIATATLCFMLAAFSLAIAQNKTADVDRQAQREEMRAQQEKKMSEQEKKRAQREERKNSEREKKEAERDKRKVERDSKKQTQLGWENFKQADIDKDGKLSRTEAAKGPAKGVYQNFDKMDTNKDGFVTREERQVFRSAK